MLLSSFCAFSYLEKTESSLKDTEKGFSKNPFLQELKEINPVMNNRVIKIDGLFFI